MKKVIVWVLLGALSIASYTLDISAAAQPISGIDISAKKNPGGVRSEMHMSGTGKDMHHMMMHATGMTSSGVVAPRPPKPPMGTGAMMGSGMIGSGGQMDHEMMGLHMAIRQLSPADHLALIQMIREYLISKGIDPTKYAEIREEVKEIRKDAHTDIKEIRKTALTLAKAKREEMKAKVDVAKSGINDFNSSRSNRERLN